MKPAIHLLTLGVADLAESLAFYERVGWKAAPESVEGNVVFFQANGFVFGLYPQKELSKDIQAGSTMPAPGGITMAQNFHDEEAMKAGLAAFEAAGGRVLRAPFKAPWGLIAYAADPDGHVWEFAHVPGFEPNAEGGFTLPSEAAS